jgi:Ca2+/H+ antiporter
MIVSNVLTPNILKGSHNSVQLNTIALLNGEIGMVQSSMLGPILSNVLLV